VFYAEISKLRISRRNSKIARIHRLASFATFLQSIFPFARGIRNSS